MGNIISGILGFAAGVALILSTMVVDLLHQRQTSQATAVTANVARYHPTTGEFEYVTCGDGIEKVAPLLGK